MIEAQAAYHTILVELRRAHTRAIEAAYEKGVKDGMEAQRRVDEVGRKHKKEGDK